MKQAIKFIDFNRKYQRYETEIDAAIKRVFRRGQFINGPELAELERRFSSYLGVKYAVGLNSGTDAIALALKASGIKPKDEVITAAHTALPTVAAIRLTGATPVLVDVNEGTLNIDPQQIEKQISKKTKAILPVHLYGYPADMEPILKIAKLHNLRVVEDACQAHGAKFKDKMVGTIGDAGCFSFYPTKNLGAFGDAGMIVTNNKQIAETARMLRTYGEISKDNSKIEGVNSRLDEIQAAILNWQLGELDGWNKQRQNLANRYLKNLAGLPIKFPPKGDKLHKPVWHQFVIRATNRDALKAFLKQRGIETIVHYPTPVFKQPAYKFLKYKEKDYPATTKAAADILSLPLYPELKVSEVNIICDSIRDYYKK